MRPRPGDNSPDGTKSETGRVEMDAKMIIEVLVLLLGASLGSVIVVQVLVLWALKRSPDPPPSPDQLRY